jgi:hypothetical protein
VQQWQADKRAEQDILDHPQFVRGITTVPGNERGVLMQPRRRTWCEWRNDLLLAGYGRIPIADRVGDMGIGAVRRCAVLEKSGGAAGAERPHCASRS